MRKMSLQAYLDQMSPLMLEKDLRDSDKGSEVRTLARARTLTVLKRLDASRKAEIMQFLYEAHLVNSEDGGKPVISLNGADLHDTSLVVADLRGADLGAADLSGADLSGATGVEKNQLAQAKSLKGATMPNGQKYKDWLKEKKDRGNGENSSSS